jgi:hypothetical protein
VSALDIAIQQNAVNAVEMMVKILTTHQNKPSAAHLLNGKLVKIMDMNINISGILTSECGYTTIKHTNMTPYVVQDEAVHEGVNTINWDMIPHE